MDYVDVRSDTVTKPTEAMRKAMFLAEVGDDVYREDPSVNALEEEVADLLGKEAALFCPSGSMTNQIGIWVNTREGEEVIMERDCHVYNYEAGAPAMLSRVLTKLLPGRRGVLTAAQIAENMVAGDLHQARTGLVEIENTHNKQGGTIFPIDEIQRIGSLCKERGVRFHMDGARIWNASAATGIPEADYAQHVDTISVCFSKGLGAPVGSALVGDAETIDMARRRRKVLGGAMRQAGFLAGAARYALRHHRERLAEDHANAKRLADGLREIPGFSVDPADPETNILMINVTGPVPAPQVAEALKRRGVLINGILPTRLRAVTHLDVTAADMDRIIDAFADVSKSLPKG